MKKFAFAFIAVLALFMISGCSPKDEIDNGNENNNEIVEDGSDNGNSNTYSSFYTEKFEDVFTAVYDDPEGKITFQYPKQMKQTDSSLDCLNPFLTISVDHGVQTYGDRLEDARTYLEDICDSVENTTIGGKEAVKGIYEREILAGGQYIVFVGGETHKFLTITFAVMPGYASEYSKVIDKILAELTFK